MADSMATKSVPLFRGRLAGTGIALIILGIATFIIFARWLHTETPIDPSGLAPFFGVAAFFIGWVLIGASLRPRGSAVLGAFLAWILYLGIGVAYTFLLLGIRVLETPLVIPYVASVWPWHIPSICGWLGPA